MMVGWPDSTPGWQIVVRPNTRTIKSGALQLAWTRLSVLAWAG